jgi:hypothetical protein
MAVLEKDIADWERAPGLLEGAINLRLTPEQCDLEYWLRAVAQGTLAGLVRGHHPNATVPIHMLQSDPLREAIMDEFAFRSIAEDLATRAISYLIAFAPTTATMEFYTTQLVDECRHAWAFRHHLLELGVELNDLPATIEGIAGRNRDSVLKPLEAFGLNILRDKQDFIGGVVILTILVEGVLAPAAELSEKKWRILDPAAASIERGANIDELRHLTVGSEIVRRYLIEYPQEKERILELIHQGRRLWQSVPVEDVTMKRELLFQQGLELHADLIDSYELTDDKRLVDTSIEDRLTLSWEWSRVMQNERLSYMGLEEARA